METIINICNKDNNDVFVVLLSKQQFIFHPVINYLLYSPTGQEFCLWPLMWLTTTTTTYKHFLILLLRKYKLFKGWHNFYLHKLGGGACYTKHKLQNYFSHNIVTVWLYYNIVTRVIDQWPHNKWNSGEQCV